MNGLTVEPTSTSIKSGYTARIKVDPYDIVIDYENEWQLQ